MDRSNTTIGFPRDGVVHTTSADQKLDASRVGDGALPSIHVARHVPTSAKSLEF